MTRPTIKDVASMAGVSVMTASRALNNQPYVSAEAARRVQAAVEALGFHRNAFARGLPSAQSFIVLMLIGQGAPDLPGQFQRHAVERCRHLGRHLIVDRAPRDGDAVAYVEGLIDRLRPEGVLLWRPLADDPGVLAMLAARSIAFVRIDADPALSGGMVSIDHAEAVTTLVDSLGGGRAVALVHSESDTWLAKQRREAVLAAAGAAAGAATGNVRLCPAPSGDFGAGLEWGRRLAAEDETPALIIADRDELALGLLAAIKAQPAGRRPTLVCLEDTGSVRLVAPEVVRLIQPLEAMAHAALDMCIQHNPTAPVRFQSTFARSNGTGDASG